MHANLFGEVAQGIGVRGSDPRNRNEEVKRVESRVGNKSKSKDVLLSSSLREQLELDLPRTL